MRLPRRTLMALSVGLPLVVAACDPTPPPPPVDAPDLGVVITTGEPGTQQRLVLVTNHGTANAGPGVEVVILPGGGGVGAVAGWSCSVVDPSPAFDDESYSCISAVALAPGETVTFSAFFPFSYGSAEAKALPGETNLANNSVACLPECGPVAPAAS